jgi:hypothetical protein
LTHDERIAKAAAGRVSPVNRPNIPDATFESGNARIVRVDTSAYADNTIDLGTPIGRVTKTANPKNISNKLARVFYNSVEGVNGDSSFAKFFTEKLQGKATAEAWNQYRVLYKQFYGNAPSESLVNKFQSLVTKQFQEASIHAGVFKGADGTEFMVIYEPKYLSQVDEVPVNLTNQLSEGLEYQRYLDQRTNELLPDEVDLANLKSSQKAVLDYKLQQTSEALMDETVKTVDEVDNYYNVRREMIGQTVTERKAQIDNLELNTPKIEADRLGKQRAARYDKRNEINPC